jgi:hypothetical protein
MPVVYAVDVEVEGVVGHLQQVADRVEQQDPQYPTLVSGIGFVLSYHLASISIVYSSAQDTHVISHMNPHKGCGSGSRCYTCFFPEVNVTGFSRYCSSEKHW